jgi:Uma2 family endonuclease
VATVQSPAEQRFVLRNVDWQRYVAISDAIGEVHVRVTYDRGNLELMTVSHGHERWGKLLDRFFAVLVEELSMPCQSGGSTTFRREDLERGIEPDDCYYLDNEPLVRDKDEIDLTIDPPPDLAFEIDISRSSLNRMGIYAAIRVPEVWRFDSEVLRVYHLTDEGRYVEVDRSRYFPFLSLRDLEAFLHRRGEMDETSLIKTFRLWVRDQMARGWPSSSGSQQP